MAEKDTTKKRHWPAILIVSSCALIFLISSMTYTVSNSEHVIVTRFGGVSKVAEPGLRFKLPYPIDDIVRIDKRLQHFERPLAQTALKGLRNFLVAISSGWKIDDPQKFYKTLGSLKAAKIRMENIIGTPASSIFSEYELNQIFTTDRKLHKVDDIRDRILVAADILAKEYGIKITYIGFSQLALPPDATKSNLDRMRKEREKVAAHERNKGKGEASRIENEAKADYDKTINKAKNLALAIKRKGDEQAIEIYKSFKNPELISFLRQLESLEKMLSANNTQLVIDLNTPPFNLLSGDFFKELKKRSEKK